MENYIGKICPYCKTEIRADDAVQICPKCGIAHHKSCWDENLGCTTFGCSGNHGQSKANVVICESCGTAMESTQKFCPKCGKPQIRRAQPAVGQAQKTCPNCGTSNNAANKFCVRCSASLNSPSAAPSAFAPPAAGSTASAPAAAGLSAYTSALNAPPRSVSAAPAATAATATPESFPSAQSMPGPHVKPINAKLPKLIASLLGILSGLLSVVLGIVTFGMGTGSFESSQSYGGDAYTGIQNAAAQSANNILYESEVLRFGLGSLLLVLGLFMIALFAFVLFREREKAAKSL